MNNLGVTVGIIAKQSSSSALGKIMLRDENKTVFENKDTAKAYIQQFTDAEITEESFDTLLNAYFFTVPSGSDFNLVNDFCSSNTNSQYLQFIDEFGLVKTFGDNAFYQNEANNYIKNSIFGASCFYGSKGNNILKNIVVIGDDFFRFSSGKNIIDVADIISNYCFGSVGSIENKFYLCRFKGDYSFSNNAGYNEFYNCAFANFNFTGSSGENKFHGNANFQASCFYLARSNNFFFDNVFATTSFFYRSQSSNNYFYKNLQVGDSAFTNAYSNNFINSISAGNNLFRTASPTGKNTIITLVSCGDNSFRDYIGCIYFHNLGNDFSQTLPADIFTVTTECSVNFDFKLKANNDADYLQMVTNITANPAQKQITLF